jgi:histidinol-phosphate/aromatic aminotransferase/cobyric acid decarboxylase-like protein
MRKNETADEIIAEMRRNRDMNALADRLANAIGRERDEWQNRIKDVQDVADAFKNELNHVLDLIAYNKSQKKENEK